MIIPIQVPADAKPVLASERRFNLKEDHPLYSAGCPVCDDILGSKESVLILAGIAPENRRPAGSCTGEGVMVHAECAGY